MNTNASMIDRFFAVLFDLLTFLGLASGIAMLTFSFSEIDTEVKETAALSTTGLLKLFGILVLVYFVLDVLLVRIFATTPGKLAMNCDVDFHRGNSMIYCIIRSFFRVICLFTIIPAIFSYLSASANIDSQTFHDRIAKTNVTNSTRMPRWVGVVIVLLGIALLVYFIINHHDVFGLNIKLGLPDFKIFTF